MKICIISDQHLCANPRVWKEAKTLSDNHYEVVVVTQFTSASQYEKDREILEHYNIHAQYKSGLNLIPGQVSVFKLLYYKLRRRAAIIFKKLGVELKYLISYSPNDIYKAAKRENADLYIAHVECGFYAGKKLVSDSKLVAFDLEDWHSRDYLIQSRPVNTLSKLESFGLHNGVYFTCPSQSMSDAIFDAYGKRHPEVIYNGFLIEDYDETQTTGNDKPSLVWFSQTIGAGRGVEKIVDVLHDIREPLSLNLIGNCSVDYEDFLKGEFPFELGHELRIIPPVKHYELHKMLCRYDIGLALEHKDADNKRTTVSNKMLQYLQAGLKVFATDTDGQLEIAKKFPEVVKTVPADKTDKWSIVLSGLLQHTDYSRKDIVERHDKEFSWEAQESKLLTLVKKALNG
ncbi:MAG: glycosyltransferase [Chitinophagales bacterium]|nr:glycosyltransferase [Chitinophagaceae bacterium]MCB9064648.1 glycosyltransferase [Chitinophagales bacterium]